MVKKFFAVFLAVVVLAFVAALPAVASPPEAAPILEVASLSMGNAFGVYSQEAPVAAAPASSILEPRVINFASFSTLGFALVLISIASAATLAGLLRGNASQVMRERNGRGFANGREERRRWV